MNTEFENMALLNIEDYNELKAKAEATDEQIKKQAEEMAKPEVVTLKVCFDTYGLLYSPYTCVGVEIPFYDDKKIRDMLNKASADIMVRQKYGKIQQRTQRIQIYKKTLRRTKKAYRKSRKAPLKACIGKRYFIYYISCGYNCSFHINSKLKKYELRKIKAIEFDSNVR